MKNQTTAIGMKEYTSTLARRNRFEGSGVPRGFECRQEKGKGAYLTKRDVCPKIHLSAGTLLKVKNRFGNLIAKRASPKELGSPREPVDL